MKRIRLFISALVLAIGSVIPLLSPGIAHAVANNCTWTGASSNNFNTAGNWSTCNSTVPQTGDNLIFDATSLSADATLTNNIVSLSVNTITFQGTNSGFHRFTIAGNAITIAAGIVTSGEFPTINTSLTLGADQAFTGIGFSFGESGTPTLTMGGHNLTIGTGSDTPFVTVDGSISGTGNLSLLNGATIDLNADNSSWTGSTINLASGASVQNEKATGLGASSNSVTIASGAMLSLCGLNGATVAQNITMAGDGGGFGAIDAAVACGMSGGSDTSPAKATLSGSITLSADTTVESQNVLTITGALSGSHTLSITSVSAGTVVINSSNNTSQTPNGTLQAPIQNVDYNANTPSTPLTIPTNTIGTVDGTYGDTTVLSGATMKGSGTVGALDVFGTIAPGHSPGCITSADLSITTGTYQAEIGGTDACTGYDQLKVTGTVTLNSSTLQVSRYNNFKPAKGATYTIIDNDSSDAVVGTFANLDEGATLTVDGYVFAISYVGGDGNDVVLTVQNVPAAPDTGFTLLKNNPIMSAAVILFAAGGVAYIANGKKLAFSRSRARR